MFISFSSLFNSMDFLLDEQGVSEYNGSENNHQL